VCELFLFSSRKARSSHIVTPRPRVRPPALSPGRHVLSLCAGGRVDAKSNPHVPSAVPRSSLLAPACLCSTSMNITPLQRPVALPPGFPFRENHARWAAGHVAQLVERGRLTFDNNRHERAHSVLWRHSDGQWHMAVRYGPRPHVCEQASEAPHVGGLGFCTRGEGKGLGRPAPSFASTAVASAALLAEVVRRVQAATVAVGAVAVMPAAVAVLRSRV